VDGAKLECGRIEIEAPESEKNFRLLLEHAGKFDYL
jgi:hypothetical protein